MDKEKEIERIATIIACSICGGDRNSSCEDICDVLKKARKKATILVNAGYGNVKQAVKEFASELKERVCGGVYEDEDLYVKNKWYTQKEFVIEIIDNLITELYGASDKE